MAKISLFILFFFTQPLAHPKVLFTKHCEKAVVKLINDSKDSINIAVYSINNENIISALEKAKERNVKIHILTDRIQVFGKGSKVKLLHDEDFDIKIHSRDRIMHHKFAIFDNKKAVEGSFNWTNSAATKNTEDCNIFSDEKDIRTLNRRFKKLWKLNSKEASDCYFGNMEIEKSERRKCGVG